MAAASLCGLMAGWLTTGIGPATVEWLVGAQADAAITTRVVATPRVYDLLIPSDVLRVFSSELGVAQAEVFAVPTI